MDLTHTYKACKILPLEPSRSRFHKHVEVNTASKVEVKLWVYVLDHTSILNVLDEYDGP
jgi:hypothetical protein